MIPIILVSTSGESTASLQSSLTLKADASLLDIVDEDCYGAYHNEQHTKTQESCSDGIASLCIEIIGC